MTKAARDAELIRESIAHWERMRDDKRVDDEKPGPLDCALCGEYNNDETPFYDGCTGCPVAAKTDGPHCWGTPYDEARANWYRYGPTSPKFRAAAQRMIDFLAGLLPEGQQS